VAEHLANVAVLKDEREEQRGEGRGGAGRRGEERRERAMRPNCTKLSESER